MWWRYDRGLQVLRDCQWIGIRPDNSMFVVNIFMVTSFVLQSLCTSTLKSYGSSARRGDCWFVAGTHKRHPAQRSASSRSECKGESERHCLLLRIWYLHHSDGAARAHHWRSPSPCTGPSQSKSAGNTSWTMKPLCTRLGTCGSLQKTQIDPTCYLRVSYFSIPGRRFRFEIERWLATAYRYRSNHRFAGSQHNHKEMCAACSCWNIVMYRNLPKLWWRGQCGHGEGRVHCACVCI